MTEPHRTRAVNEWLSAKAPKAEVLALMCECGAARCRTLFQLSAADYHDVRTQSDTSLVVPDHHDESAFETLRWWPDVVLVRSRVGVPPAGREVHRTRA